MTPRLIAATTIFSTIATLSIAQDMTLSGVLDLPNTGPYTQRMIDANGFDLEEEMQFEIWFEKSLPPTVTTTPGRSTVRYRFDDYQFTLGDHAAKHNSALPDCSIRLATFSSGTAADYANLLCRVGRNSSSDFPNLGTVRWSIRYPQGFLRGLDMEDPDILKEADLYTLQSDGGWATWFELELYSVSGTTLPTGLIARQIGDFNVR